MFKFRLMLWMVVFLMLFAACTQAEPVEESSVVEATEPAATVTEPTTVATKLPAAVEPEADALNIFVDQLQTAATDSSDLFPFVETEVNFVMAQQDVVMYRGPGDTYDERGGIADGQTALVTGQSEDGSWWRVICPDDTIGDCWVTADPAFTLPTGSVPDQSG